MEFKQQFNDRWHDIRNIILSEAKRQIKYCGKVDAAVLSERLREETGKWQRGILSQGIWYRKFAEESPQNAAIFDKETEKLSLVEPDKNKMPNKRLFYIVAIVMTAALAYMLHTTTELSIVKLCFYPVLFFVIAHTLYVPFDNKRKEQAASEIIQEIDRQLEEMYRTLEQII